MKTWDATIFLCEWTLKVPKHLNFSNPDAYLARQEHALCSSFSMLSISLRKKVTQSFLRLVRSAKSVGSNYLQTILGNSTKYWFHILLVKNQLQFDANTLKICFLFDIVIIFEYFTWHRVEVVTSVSKKSGQTTVVIQYYSLSRFFWNRR